MIFDREALSDFFDSKSLAKEIRRQFNLGIEPTPLKKIAKAIGIINIREEPLKSIEGALVVPIGKFDGEIILNKNQYPPRKRFTLAHELGHFVHPLHHPDSEGRFNCSNEDIFKTQTNGERQDIEAEANEFASELLMPAEFLINIIESGHELDFSQIIALCKQLDISVEFVIRKLQPLCMVPTAFIFTLNGNIRYIYRDKFPYMKVWSKKLLPQNTFSLSNKADNSISRKVMSDASVWLKHPQSMPLYEQLYVQENGYAITMLTIAKS